ncbi:MAG: TetR/AcrR family transcriptional regulator [Ilumatobacteraceae bacterium]
MPKAVKSVPYNNTARATQSHETRQRILESARTLMLERGYRATTIAAIARHAAVHVDTVYELVGRKPIVLHELIEQAISGTDRAVPAEDRRYVADIRAEPDPRRKLAIYAEATREIHVRMAPLVLAVREAATTEPDAKQIWQDISQRRAANMGKLARELAEAGGLRRGLSIDEAADVIWATNSAELFLMLTTERGWTPDRYQRWLTDAWCRLLLPDQ